MENSGWKMEDGGLKREDRGDKGIGTHMVRVDLPTFGSRLHRSVPPVCLLLGYSSGALSLCLPAVEPGMFTEGYGYECLIWSVLWMFELTRWPDLSLADGVKILAGWANVWLMAGWIVLFFKSRTARVVSTIWGYAGLGIALSIWPQMQGGAYIGYWLWCAAFLLVATGTLLSAQRT